MMPGTMALLWSQLSGGAEAEDREFEGSVGDIMSVCLNHKKMPGMGMNTCFLVLGRIRNSGLALATYQA